MQRSFSYVTIEESAFVGACVIKGIDLQTIKRVSAGDDLFFRVYNEDDAKKIAEYVKVPGVKVVDLTGVMFYDWRIRRVLGSTKRKPTRRKTQVDKAKGRKL